jgi:hypothetical protein
MTMWDRVQRLELELAQARASQQADRLMLGELLMSTARLTIERDTARALACRLEQELAHVEGRDDDGV